MTTTDRLSTASATDAEQAVHVIVPDGIDDPARSSGGNVYDRRICSGLTDAGWHVTEHAAAGSWPRPARGAVAELAALIASVPDGSVVLVDGLIASTVPDVLVPEQQRLRMVVLVHLPLGDGPPGHEVAGAAVAEAAVLSAATAIIATSGWTRQRLLDQYGLPASRVHIAEPGVDMAHLASGTGSGRQLLCVAAVTAHKGHDVLMAALSSIADLPWRCSCVGSLDQQPDFVQRLRRQAEADGIADRVCFSGARTGRELDKAYAGADALVLASRAETYGMVVTEALARGVPVIATAVGGLPSALGHAGDGRLPGMLVPPGDVGALAAALRSWLTDAELRQRLQQAARDRRTSLSTWSATTAAIARVLTAAAM